MPNFLKYFRKVALVKPIFPLTLLLTTLTLLGFWRYGLSLEFLFYVLFLPLFGTIFLIDLKVQKILDIPIIGIGTLGILRLITFESYTYLLSPLISVPIIWILTKMISHVKKTKSLGEGDILLIGACSFWLSPLHLPYFAMAVGGFGIILGLVWRKKFQKSVFPFAPAILLGMVLTRLIFGGET